MKRRTFNFVLLATAMLSPLLHAKDSSTNSKNAEKDFGEKPLMKKEQSQSPMRPDAVSSASLKRKKRKKKSS